MHRVSTPPTPVHVLTCDAFARMVLPDGLMVERYDSVTIDTIGGHDEVSSVQLHVSATRDMPSTREGAEGALEHAAGDCWREVWSVGRDPTGMRSDFQVTRIFAGGRTTIQDGTGTADEAARPTAGALMLKQIAALGEEITKSVHGTIIIWTTVGVVCCVVLAIGIVGHRPRSIVMSLVFIALSAWNIRANLTVRRQLSRWSEDRPRP